jgi:hypothetical protein
VRAKTLWSAVAAFALATTLATAAVAANHSVGDGNAAVPDLTSAAAIDDYLTTLGVDPSAVIKQQGLLNYAGPNCPGLGWNCTLSTQVLQIALPGGTNIVECGDPALVGLDPATLFGTEPTAPYLGPSPQVCVGVQIQQPLAGARGDSASNGNSGNNHMRCHVRTKNPAAAAQPCDITQMNPAGGKNHASVFMFIDENGTGASQTARQVANVRQSNTTGDNHLVGTQIVKQNLQARSSGPEVVQSQQAHQSFCVWQGGPAPPEDPCGTSESETSGDNFSQIHQQQDQSEKAEGATASAQDQNTLFPADFRDCEPFDFVEEPNMCVNLEQHSAGGQGNSQLEYHLNQDMRTDSDLGFQTQGSPAGGLAGDVTQLTPGPKQHHAALRERQFEFAGASTVDQDQFDPSECCATQEPPNPNDRVNIDQTSEQRAEVAEVIAGGGGTAAAAATNPDAFQDALLIGHFVSGGNGLIKHVVRQNEGGTTQTCPPEGFDPDPYPGGQTPTCALVTSCENGQCPPPVVDSVDARGDRVWRK